jgi:hypothetical protein
LEKEFISDEGTKIVFADRWHQMLIQKKDKIHKVVLPESIGRELFSIFHGGIPEDD